MLKSDRGFLTQARPGSGQLEAKQDQLALGAFTEPNAQGRRSLSKRHEGWAGERRDERMHCWLSQMAVASLRNQMRRFHR